DPIPLDGSGPRAPGSRRLGAQRMPDCLAARTAATYSEVGFTHRNTRHITMMSRANMDEGFDAPWAMLLSCPRMESPNRTVRRIRPPWLPLNARIAPRMYRA